jgi:hypothetical protein
MAEWVQVDAHDFRDQSFLRNAARGFADTAQLPILLSKRCKPLQSEIGYSQFGLQAQILGTQIGSRSDARLQPILQVKGRFHRQLQGIDCDARPLARSIQIAFAVIGHHERYGECRQENKARRERRPAADDGPRFGI